ncbi:MAG TPA: hypothetical protein VMQ54_16025 [Steroidobacteraceae bacterium]|jgi:hypothetical protein|nr:hypothetical protein [Steroidobacteraceae bacterium]
MTSASTANTHPQGEAAFRWTVIVVQTLFGAWFLVHGLNYFVAFFKQPPGGSTLSHELIGALIHSGLFSWIKAIEIIVGVLLLAQRFVPLAVVAAFPVTIVIAYVNLAVNKDIFGLIVGVVILAANALMAFAYLDRYRPMLSYDAGLPSLKGIRAIRG